MIRAQQAAELLGGLIYVGVMLVLGAAAILFVQPLLTATNGAPPTAATLVLAALVYLTSHVLRIARVTILAGATWMSLRQLSMVHFLVGALSLVLPYKLAELYRIGELGRLLRSPIFALMVIWVERAFDFAAIVLLIVLVGASEPWVLAQIRPLIGVSVIFVTVSLLTFTVVRDGLSTLTLFIVRRYEGASAVRVLKMLQWVRQSIELAPKIMAGKKATLAILTIMIWGLELSSLWLILPTEERGVRELLSAMPMFLSSESLSGRMDVHAQAFGAFATVIGGTLLPLGAACALLYAPARLRGALHALLTRRRAAPTF